MPAEGHARRSAEGHISGRVGAAAEAFDHQFGLSGDLKPHVGAGRHREAGTARSAGGTGDLMLLLGWASNDMPRHYGASAGAERAQQTRRCHG
jgi:hypothetical protein